jgi:hypothetical protein
MTPLLVVIAFNAFANEKLAQPQGGAAKSVSPKAAYCSESPSRSKNSDCAQSKRPGWTRTDASAFIHNCVQPCDSVKVFTRAEWKHPEPNAKLCNESEKKLQLEYAVLKQKERTAYCGRGSPTEANTVIKEIKAKTVKDGKEPPCMIDMDGSPKSLVIHHSEGESVDEKGKPVGPASILKYYKEEGWADIPYHYIVAKDEKGKWQIYEGRQRLKSAGDKCKWVVGGHNGPGANLDSLGIMIIGNYNTEKENPGAPQLLGPNPPEPGAVARVTQLVAALKRDCPAIASVMGHGEARARAYGCMTKDKVDLAKGNCREENKGVAGRAGCWKTCPGVGCSAIPGDLHSRVVHGR